MSTVEDIKNLIETDGCVYVVEDSQIFRGLWEDLELPKLKIFSCPSEFLKFAQQPTTQFGNADVVFADLMFPGSEIQGFQLLKLLKDELNFPGQVHICSSSITGKIPAEYDGYYHERIVKNDLVDLQWDEPAEDYLPSPKELEQHEFKKIATCLRELALTIKESPSSILESESVRSEISEELQGFSKVLDAYLIEG